MSLRTVLWRSSRAVLAASAVLGAAAPRESAAAEAPRLEVLPSVKGTELTSVEVVERGVAKATSWAALAAERAPGPVTLRLTAAGGPGLVLEVPPCAGRTAVRLDGKAVSAPAGPVLVPLPTRPDRAHEITVEIEVSTYERRVACGFAPRYGPRDEGAAGGFRRLLFASPARGGGEAVVYVPRTGAARRGAPLLVGAHPWNGDRWTYAAVAELLAAADQRGVVLLFPSGLGNSLYTERAEAEVMRAVEAALAVLPVDERRVSIWGASMGGAGATTIAFHRPDRFASVTSLFGDSKYDLSTYVRPILVDEPGAHRVNALDVVDNARHLDVWLIHGDKDRVSPLVQSTWLDDALRSRGFAVRFDKVEGAGHGRLVARFAAAIVDRAAKAERPAAPTRVSFRSVRSGDTGAFGVRLVRSGRDDAFVDLERRGATVLVHRASGVRAIELAAPFATGLVSPIAVERAEGVAATLEVRLADATAP